MRKLGTIAAAAKWIDERINNTTAFPISATSTDPNTPPLGSTHNNLETHFIDFDNAHSAPFTRSPNSPNLPDSSYTYAPIATQTFYTPQSSYSQANFTLTLGRSEVALGDANRIRYRQHAWWHRVMTDPNQLRQRVAWALAQIISVGKGDASFDDRTRDNTLLISGMPDDYCSYMGLSGFYDIFIRNAFKSYRDVIGEVTYSPIMGKWLSSVGNKREATGSTSKPDENYAREVMQLFTIGLFQLNDDGTVKRDSSGVPLNTYDINHITQYAKIFTGLFFGFGDYVPGGAPTSGTPYSPYANGSYPTDLNGVKLNVPMRMVPGLHDRGEKVLLSGTLRAGVNNLTVTNHPFSSTSSGEQAANNEIKIALDGLVNHSSCPPFIATRLIQRLVKSNPSRAYVNRVAQVFKNGPYTAGGRTFGAAGRGNLAAVTAAILLDQEAWVPIRTQYLRSPDRIVVTTMGTEDSRLQEPVLTYTRFLRFFKASCRYAIGSNATGTFVEEPSRSLPNQFRLETVNGTFAQSPYEQPSVFNFYLADYGVSSGYASTSGRLPFADEVGNPLLVGPEFMIVNAISSNNIQNFFRSRATETQKSETNTTWVGDAPGSTKFVLDQGNAGANPPRIPRISVATDSMRSIMTYDQVTVGADTRSFSTQCSQLMFPGTTVLAQREAAVDALLKDIDLYICGGTMNQGFKSMLRQQCVSRMTAVAGSGISLIEASDIVRGVIMCTFTTPSFLVTE
jgi:uncharacterized protein (DUF1800 family)